ncbi:hypothetical protein [Nocardia sp. NPDC049707]|uniref:hypothetical protein n=1 Tax=Nocardia sp. NPDC049707 TaxID=3154735 RepID=UPI00341BBE5C
MGADMRLGPQGFGCLDDKVDGADSGRGVALAAVTGPALAGQELLSYRPGQLHHPDAVPALAAPRVHVADLLGRDLAQRPSTRTIDSDYPSAPQPKPTP